MKKPFWSERRFERRRLFCSVALVVEASEGSREVKGIMITLQPRRSFAGLHIPPSDPSIKTPRFGWWWNSIALQRNMNVLLRGEYRCCSVQEVHLDKMEVGLLFFYFFSERFTESWRVFWDLVWDIFHVSRSGEPKVGRRGRFVRCSCLNVTRTNLFTEIYNTKHPRWQRQSVRFETGLHHTGGEEEVLRSSSAVPKYSVTRKSKTARVFVSKYT